MSAPATHASIPLAHVYPSPTNPRKHFDAARLADLTESVKKLGVLEPVLVRPYSRPNDRNAFELVAGERRYRAAKAAGLEYIPAISRELSDAETLEIQVVENVQREDLHPLEEADGYHSLLACQHGDGHAYTVEEIAAKVGKSASYVYQRLKLSALTGKSREAFECGHFGAAHALLLARIADPKEQDEAFVQIVEDGLMDIASARHFIQRRYMHGMAKPPFDVTAIYFPKTGAQPIGVPCGECPKRSLNQPALFEDMAAGDFCTDTACYEAKTLAAVEVEAEKKRAKGHAVLTGEAAAKVVTAWGDVKGGYVKDDAYCYEAKDPEKYSKALAGLKVQVTLIANPHRPGEWVKAYEKKAALDALEKAGLLKKAVKAAKVPTPAERSQAQEEKEAVELAIHKALRAKLLDPGVESLEALRVIAREAWNFNDVAMEIQDLAAPKGTLDWKNMGHQECYAVLLDTVFPEIDYETPERHALAKALGIDVAAVKKQAKKDLQAERAAEEKAKAEAKAAPKAKAPAKKPAAKKAPPAARRRACPRRAPSACPRCSSSSRRSAPTATRMTRRRAARWPRRSSGRSCS